MMAELARLRQAAYRLLACMFLFPEPDLIRESAEAAGSLHKEVSWADEFAFYGPMAFDIGALLGNYLLAYMAQPGQATDDDDRVRYSQWILETVTATWAAFENEFRRLWGSERTGEFFPASTFDESDACLERALSTFLATVLEDSIGFAAAKMIRRVAGVSHVEDLLSISDADQRAKCERHVLMLARAMLLGRNVLGSIEDVILLARETRARDPQYP